MPENDLGFRIGIDDFQKMQSQVTAIEKRLGNFAQKGQKGFNDLSNSAEKIPDSMDKVRQSIDSTFAVQKLNEFAGAFKSIGLESLRLADTQARAERKVEQAIKSTNASASRSLKDLKKQATELQKTTLFGDEDILNNVSAQLLTFTNIAGEQFDRTQRIALDLATVLDSDVKGAAIQLGKALNDTTGAGLSALNRSGIQFTADQKELIKSLFDTNRIAEAQNIILTELERQYGGQAQAAAAASDGMVQFENTVGDLKEEIGRELQPILRGMLDILKDVVGFMSRNKKVIVAVGIALTVLAGGIAAATTAMKIFTAVSAINPFVLLATGIAAATVALVAFVALQDKANKRTTALTSSTNELLKKYKEIAKIKGLAGVEDVIAGISGGRSGEAQKKVAELTGELANLNKELENQTAILARREAELARTRLLQNTPSPTGTQSFAGSTGPSAINKLTSALNNQLEVQKKLRDEEKKRFDDLISKRNVIQGAIDAITGALEKQQAAAGSNVVSIKFLTDAIGKLTKRMTEDVRAGGDAFKSLGREIRRARFELDILKGKTFEIESLQGIDNRVIRQSAVVTLAETSGLDPNDIGVKDTLDLPARTLESLPEVPKMTQDIIDLTEAFDQLGQAIAENVAGAFADLAFNMGHALGAGEKFFDALHQFMQQLLVEVPKMVGMFLINLGLQTSFAPGGAVAGIPLIAAGLGLVGLSGIAGGLLSRQSNDVGNVSAPNIQGVGQGLSAFNAGSLTNQFIIQIGNEEITDFYVRQVGLNNELSGK